METRKLRWMNGVKRKGRLRNKCVRGIVNIRQYERNLTEMVRASNEKRGNGSSEFGNENEHKRENRKRKTKKLWWDTLRTI